MSDRNLMDYPHKLVLHPDCKVGPIKSVCASIKALGNWFEVEFRLQGVLSAIRLAAPQPACRRDELWKTTCFEVFWQAEVGEAYREYNFSPSGCWAAYHFDSERVGMRDASVDAVSIMRRYSNEELGLFTLRAVIANEAPSALPAKVAITAVVECSDGQMQYWSLAFPAGKPDFHSPTCRQIVLQAD